MRKLLSLFAAIGLFAGFAQTASAQAVGTVQSISDIEGSVIVTRGGQGYSLAADDVLFEGDRIATRSNGAATIIAYDCTVSLDALTMVVVNSAFCSTKPVKFSDNTVSLGNTVRSPGFATIALAGLGIGGAIALASGGDDDETPASP